MTYIRFSFSIGSKMNGVNYSAIWVENSNDEYTSGRRLASLFGNASWFEARSRLQDSITTIKDYGMFRRPTR